MNVQLFPFPLKDPDEIDAVKRPILRCSCLVSKNGISDDMHISVLPCNQNRALRHERFLDERLLLAFKIVAIQIDLDQLGKRALITSSA